MKTLTILLCWIAVFALAAQLRFQDLGSRPFHADEATGAKITAQRLQTGNYVFDPTHYHGPLLSELGVRTARLAGETTWTSLQKSTLRWVPAITGFLVVLLPLLGCRRFGQAPMLLASLALATSPLLVYYSRMYIHEILLALFGLLALFQFATHKRWWPAGIWIGLMFATKETFVISLAAWFGAATILYLGALRSPDRPAVIPFAKAHWRALLGTSLLALTVSLFFYTNAFRYWPGAIDSVRTYFVYETVEGHDKPIGYYANLLLIPDKAGGLWWFETPVLIAAIIALLASFLLKEMPARTRFAIRFLSLAATFHFVAYSLIAYKTPWLMVLPWAHLCVLAGFSACLIKPQQRLLTATLSLALLAGFASQWQQSRNATGRFASDSRNPYAYVPTSNDIETLAPWLDSLDAAIPDLPLSPIAVVGQEFWPLPWYLRDRSPVGYSSTPPTSIERLPLVISLTDLNEQLAATHIPIPRGLRTDTPMIIWVRSDFWKASIQRPTEDSN